MIIAVTYENGQVFQHFGHSEQFKLYQVEENKILASKVIGTEGSGHSALADLLNDYEVDVLICGGIGMGAKNALAAVGIQLFGGVSGEADAAVEALLAGNLNYNPDVMCNHHGHDHSHGTCGNHECGRGNCHQ